jgi:type IV secretion system protein TrbL
MPNGGVLTPLLRLFLGNFTQGTARLTPEALWLLTPLLTIELTLAAVYFLLRHDVDYGHLVTKFLTAVILGWLITNWPSLTSVLAKSFIRAGLLAGGDAISETDFTDPDTIALYGMSVTAVIFGAIGNASLLAPSTYVTAYMMGLVAAVVVIVYFLLALTIFISILEYYASVVLTVFLLPFGMFPRTAFLADKAIAHIFASAIRLFALAFVLSSALPVLVAANVTLQPTMATAFLLLLAALALLFLAYVVNKWVSGILYGAASLMPQDLTTLGHRVTHAVTHLGTAVQSLTQVVMSLSGQATPRPPSLSRRRP